MSYLILWIPHLQVTAIIPELTPRGGVLAPEGLIFWPSKTLISIFKWQFQVFVSYLYKYMRFFCLYFQDNFQESVDHS